MCVIFERFGHRRKNKGFAGKVVLFTCVLNELIDGLCCISYGRSFHSLILTREEMSYSIK